MILLAVLFIGGMIILDKKHSSLCTGTGMLKTIPSQSTSSLHQKWRTTTASTQDMTPENVMPSSAGIMQTVEDTVLFSSDTQSSTRILNVPAGQMVRNSGERKSWIAVELFNGGPKGYIKRDDLKWPGMKANIVTPPCDVSLINPEADTVELLFIKEPYIHPEYHEAQGVDFKAVARQFGLSGKLSRPIAQDKVLLLPNGLYATINRNYDNSSVFFFNAKNKKVLGVVHPTPPNWDLNLCNNKLYAIHTSSITIIDYKNMKIIGLLPIGGKKSLCWKNKKLYVSLPKGDAVAILNPETDSVIKKLRVGPAPEFLWQCRGSNICVQHYGEYYED